MFPHDKLDWTLSRLEQRVDRQADDAAARLDLAVHALSRAFWHDGGEAWFNKALTQSRRVHQADPHHAQALVIGGLALIGLDRLEPASRHLDEAMRIAPERADLHLAMGLLAERQKDRHGALRSLEAACRFAPDSWEAHQALGRVLAGRARELGNPKRLIERSQFHTVRALALNPPSQQKAPLLYHLSMTLIQEGRYTEAHQVLLKLQDYDAWRPKARQWLGQVMFHAGKYKNAVLYLRQHLDTFPDDAQVHARLASCYLQLGELDKAREACNRALALVPDELSARFTLGCTLLEESLPDEATRMFKEVLSDAPGHVPAFTELVRVRARARDAAWLRRALRAEITTYDRLPADGMVRTADGETLAWRSVRQRVAIVLKALSDVDPDAVGAMTGALDLTTDEGLRFLLWEAALAHLVAKRSQQAAEALTHPGQHYGAAAGRQLLALVPSLPEQLLVQGLQIAEEDLKRQAVDRHGPARDVVAHRRSIETERQEARAWQAQVLLSLGARQGRTGRNLLVRWASEADPDLSYAARAAGALHGEPEAIDLLRKQARPRRAEKWVDALVNAGREHAGRTPPHAVSGAHDRVCATCGRRGDEVAHLLIGENGATCDTCLTEIARGRRELITQDAHVGCVLCGNTTLSSRAVYVFRSVAVCATCVDASLGLTEREEIERFLASV